MLNLGRLTSCALRGARKFDGKKGFESVSRACFATKPYPMRSGYGLGSVVPPGLIDGMKREANIRGDILQVEDLLDDLESTERELILEKNGIVNTQDDSQTISDTPGIDAAIKSIARERGKLLRKKLRMYDDLISLQLEHTRARRRDEKRVFTQEEGDLLNENSFFSSSIESPINWQKTRVDYKDRAFDSIQVNAQFFDKNILSQDSNSHATQIANGAKKGTKMLGENSAKRLAAGVHNSVTRTQEIHNVESTLLVVAYATHKYVKQFNPLVLEPDKLYMAWNYMHPESPISLTATGNDAIYENENEDGEEAEHYLHIITEEFLGSAMVGMMHFIKSSSTNTEQLTVAADVKTELMKRVTSLGSVSGNASIPAQYGEKFAEQLSATGIDTIFDMVCEGYFPKLESTVVTDGIKEFKNFSPDTMSVSTDDTMWNDLSRVTNQLLVDNKQTTLKESHSGAMIKATIAGLHEAYVNKAKTLDYNSFMNAFNDYCKNGIRKPGVGVPIGINLKQLTKQEVRAIVARKWDPTTVNKTGFGSEELTGTPGAKWVNNPDQPQTTTGGTTNQTFEEY